MKSAPSPPKTARLSKIAVVIDQIPCGRAASGVPQLEHRIGEVGDAASRFSGETAAFPQDGQIVFTSASSRLERGSPGFPDRVRRAAGDAEP